MSPGCIEQGASLFRIGEVIMNRLAAINPVQWFAMPGADQQGLGLPLSEIYRQVRDVGFSAVSADPPEDGSVATYARLLADLGLAPAPGYFQASFESIANRSAILERARRVASQHAALGLDRIFIAAQFADPARFAAPGQGVEHEQARFSLLVQGLEATCQVMVAQGVTPFLHQHIATLIETPEETEQVLSSIGADLLLFGPDTGHLAWAGANVEDVIRRHIGRLGGVHLKDVHLSTVETGRLAEANYSEIPRRSTCGPNRARRYRPRRHSGRYQ